MTVGAQRAAGFHALLRCVARRAGGLRVKLVEREPGGRVVESFYRAFVASEAIRAQCADCFIGCVA